MIVPKLIMYTGLREKLVLQLLKLAAGPSKAVLLQDVEGLEVKITAARHVVIQPGSAADHGDLERTSAVLCTPAVRRLDTTCGCIPI
jgi:hypothetical protein